MKSDKDTDTDIMLTSSLQLLYAHVHHHGSLGVVGFDQCGEVTAVHLLDVPQIWLAVIGHNFGALFVHVQTTI